MGGVVVVVVEASTGASLDQAGETIDGLVDALETLVLSTPNDCILHVLNPVVGNTVSIQSDPPSLASQYGFLVDPVDGGTFLLQYESPNTGGQSGTITINVPLDRPRDLFVSGKTKVLVNDGFNALRKLEISDQAQVNGYMTSSEAARVQIAALDSASLAFEVGDDLVVEIDQHSDQATTERVLTARALGSSTLKLRGDVTSIRCEGTATCTVDGSLVRDPFVDNSGALSQTATFSLGAVTIDTSTTTSGSSCTNGPNPVLTATSNGNTGLWGEVDDGNGDIPSGGASTTTTTTAILTTVVVMISSMSVVTSMFVV
eukprot:CAMPEP_0113447184 /NCGR_PEP_ID=MMETSP0014_2-20120614/4104_1 /TAXON_ID=2857 /ORGANISM="Nitzschia sp." /LENGTH=315 /DNA_ID=CAMNT_0000338325 /DNA_START=106 /DNA_END=1053 /DNA_ORIENTATION=- /assembly_acc=CAM_ASM_000159